MKQITLSLFLAFIFFTSKSQNLVKVGDKVPKYYFTKLINAPQTDFNLSELQGKPAILAFWGTWCAPCIPEIISLEKLQKQFGDKIEIIGVSNDNEQKLKLFLQKRPSKLWFASDPTNNLFNIFNFNTVGHAVLVNKNNKIVGIVDTDKIDSTVVQQLIDSKPFDIEENRGDIVLSRNEDPIKSDSSTLFSFLLQPELKGIAPMMKRAVVGPFANRRITIINLYPIVILKEAFNISSFKRICFSTLEDSLKSIQKPLCVDLIVPANKKQELMNIFQDELNRHLPVKGEIQKKIIACFVLKPIEGKQVSIKESSSSDNSYFANGLKFDGTGVPISTFTNYLENELQFPVYDATGLTKYYDLKLQKNNIEPLESIKENLSKMGLELIRGQKEMNILVISSK